MKYLAIKRKENGNIYVSTSFFYRFTESDLSQYGFIKVEVPEGYVDINTQDFNEDLTFSIEKYNQRLIDRKKQEFREWREKYFNIIDRATWFDSLTEEEKTEVHKFRNALLDITITMEYPEIPECVLKQI